MGRIKWTRVLRTGKLPEDVTPLEVLLELRNWNTCLLSEGVKYERAVGEAYPSIPKDMKLKQLAMDAHTIGSNYACGEFDTDELVARLRKLRKKIRDRAGRLRRAA